MPIVANRGGITGSQTLTLSIRGQALGQIAAANIRWLVSEELAVGALNGLCWATAVAVVTQLWFDDWGISTVIGTALVINLLAPHSPGY
jgi:magnesium transporter